MADMTYSLWDTATFSATAKTEHALFQNRQGSDSTHDKYFTNMKGNGSFPEKESFQIEKILFFPDSDIALSDLEAYLLNSYIEIEYQEKIIFQATLRECVALSAWSGAYTLAAAADDALIGIENDGYMLKMPLNIQGGNSFRVNVGQGTALSAGTFTFKVVLQGTYKTP